MRKRQMKKKSNKIVKGLNEANIFAVTNYEPYKYDKENLKKWCIEKSIIITCNHDSIDVITSDAQKIYDWVVK